MFLLVFVFAIIVDRLIAFIYPWRALQRFILVNYFPIIFSIFCLLMTFPQNDPRFTRLELTESIPIISNTWIPCLYYILLLSSYGILYLYKYSVFTSLKTMKRIKLYHLLSFILFLFFYTCVISAITSSDSYLCFQIYFYYIVFSFLFPFILLYILACCIFGF